MSFEQTYYRPKDIENAIEWVNNNIEIGAQPRLFNLLHAMKQDEKIYISATY